MTAGGSDLTRPRSSKFSAAACQAIKIRMSATGDKGGEAKGLSHNTMTTAAFCLNMANNIA